MYNNEYKTENGVQNERDSQSEKNEQTWYMAADVEDIVGHAGQVAAVVA